MMRWLCIVAMGASLVSCASTPPGPPDWVNGRSAAYPDSRYLVGRGEAGTQEDARDRARADLAKAFEVEVSAKSSDSTRFNSGPEGAKTQSEISRSVETYTDRIVRGVQMAEGWRDPRTGSYFALAVVSRPQAAAALRAEIARLDAATRGYIGQARGAGDLLAQIASASRAVDSQRERDALERTLEVVDVGGHGVTPEFNSGELAADLAALLKRVHMKPQASSSPRLERMLSAALSASGFVPEAGDAAPYVLDGSLVLDDLGPIDGWYWMRGRLEVQLTETASGKVRGSRRWEIKTSSVQMPTAERRAYDEVDATLKRELRSAIIGFATGN